MEKSYREATCGTTSCTNFLFCILALALALALASFEFCPKEPLNRSRNSIISSILIWRKSQIFRLHLTNDFGLFNVRIQTFGKLQNCIPLSELSVNFPTQLESSRLDL